ncbi:MAG: F420-dependent NADP oxidoreductase [Candidatus Brocadiia bacterium]
MKRIIIIGAGKVGQVLGRLLNRSDRYRTTAVYCRNKKHSLEAARFIGRGVRAFDDPAKAVANGDIIFITTPDKDIQKVCDRLAEKADLKGKTVIHCSGNFPSTVLGSARLKGACIGSMHPLQTFAAPAESVIIFPGTYCACEGDRRIMPAIKDIVKSIGGVPVSIGFDIKPLYHAAGVLLSNYLVTLMDIGHKLLRRSGFSPAQAAKALLPLVHGAINNIDRLGTAGALTGPISRGDVITIGDHLKSIRRFLPAYVELYKVLGRDTVRLALEKKTISSQQARHMRKLFD